MEHYANYDSFAWVYNRYWGSSFLQQGLPVLQKFVFPHLPPQAAILEVACGSGQLAHALTDLGYRVTGLDGSTELLTFARQNAPHAEFMLADARHFDLPAQFHAAFSLYDSLNHIMQIEELAGAFGNVYKALLPGGWFVFDLNMEAGFMERWHDSFNIVQDDHVIAVRSGYREADKEGTFEFTIFTQDEDNHWQRADVTLLQRCYNQPEVESALQQVGFSDLRALDSLHDLEMAGQVGRTFFIARKPE